ncbi:hypothetical protein KDL01_35475 [Actinospica durhamensis]|uniref:Adenylate kinase n=1 Tax=Actinospica durhamensis TaxID=1508375 RepID=A0A941EY69_9ACTN|nr:hypothetical protein [Actinospica durhamensis]MBR7838623.1 hypothetical protein [Actinospica durhamensis]
MERILVSGVAGAGKTTTATLLAQRLELPRRELDALHHGPGWVKRPEFEAEVAAFTAGSRWVTEDQYSSLLGDLLWRRADTVVWLDLPRATVMRRVIRRSLVRSLTRTELWNGNRETLRGWLEPDHPARVAWRQHARKRATVLDRAAAHPHVRLIRLTSAREARAWAEGLARARVTSAP